MQCKEVDIDNYRCYLTARFRYFYSFELDFSLQWFIEYFELLLRVRAEVVPSPVAPNGGATFFFSSCLICCTAFSLFGPPASLVTSSLQGISGQHISEGIYY